MEARQVKVILREPIYLALTRTLAQLADEATTENERRILRAQLEALSDGWEEPIAIMKGEYYGK